MADHLTEEEQIETIKRWWAENGRGIVTGVVMALAGYFGFQWWQNNERTQAENASNLYQSFIEATSANEGQPDNKQLTTAKSLGRQLKEEFASRIYATQASLRLAALAAEKNDLEEAAAELQWALDNTGEEQFKLLAKRRLAAVKAARGENQEALALLEGDVPVSFSALFAETRGDILLQQGDKDAARAAYKQAEAQLLPEQAGSAQLLQMKLASLGKEEVAEDAATDLQEPQAETPADKITQPAQEGDAQ